MKLRLKDLAKKSGYRTDYIINHLGISKKTWYNWINNKTEPTFNQIVMLSRLFNEPLEAFIDDE